MLHLCSKPLVEKAQIGCINTSSIFTELIHSASVCEYYASDIFIDLQRIDNSITNAENAIYYLGYRDSGVDGNLFIASRFRENPHYNYIRLYRVCISVEENYITVELKRMSSYDVMRELGIK